MRRAGSRGVLRAAAAEADALRRGFRGDARVGVHGRDGFEALGALLPPREKRGLALIDPPYEETGRRLHAGRRGARRRRRHAGRRACVMAWYPIKLGAVAARLHRRLVDAGVEAAARRGTLRAPGRFARGPERLRDRDRRTRRGSSTRTCARPCPSCTRRSPSAARAARASSSSPATERLPPQSTAPKTFRATPSMSATPCADDRDAAPRRRQHHALVALLVDAQRLVDVRCRSIRTVTGPSGVRTTRCGTTWPSNTQRAANVTSPMPGRSRAPSGSSTPASAAGASGAVACHRAGLVDDVADDLARDRGARGADEQHEADRQRRRRGSPRSQTERRREAPAGDRGRHSPTAARDRPRARGR